MAIGADEMTADTTVEEVITRFPVAARVFVRRRMNCVGCDIARFESLAEACRIYRQPLDQLLEEIRDIARKDGSASDAMRSSWTSPEGGKDLPRVARRAYASTRRRREGRKK
jgi:hybrid cluster-associated redox disulfide protein